MRKTISLLLSFVMILALTACSQSAAPERQEGIQSAASEKQVEIQSAAQKTDKVSETNQSGASEEQKDMETELSESVSTEEQKADLSAKILVVYFSCTGTTELAAEYVTEILGADIYEIVPENPYTEADLAYYTNGRADQEQNDPDVRPAISGSAENMEQYETVFIGYPIWHGQAPRIISTFLESYDFSGKTIIPFCTSHSSGIGSSADNLRALCPESVTWLDGKRFESGVSKESVAEWIGEIGIRLIETK